MNDTANGLIAVTGATGEVGGRVARRLASRGLAQRLIVRDLKRMEAIPGADVRAIAGYQAGTEMRRALSGVGTLLLVPATEGEGRVGDHRTTVEVPLDDDSGRYVLVLSIDDG